VTDSTTATFRLPLTALLAVFGLTVCITPVAFGAPWLQVLYLLPVAIAVWLVRTRTVVDREAVVVHRVLGTQQISWSEMEGLRVDERSRVWAVLRGGKQFMLPAVRVRDLSVVAAASGGRLPDPLPSVTSPPAA
jgi:hypothetical protein